VPSTLNADVAVIGAGVIGASCAYQLTRAGRRVVVVEQCDGPAEGSTGRSFASVRSQWADDLNIELCWRSIETLRTFADEHGVDVGYRPTGYLLLVPRDAWADQLEAVKLQREHGVPVEVYDVDSAQHITPFATDGLAGATWGPLDGVVDPHLLTSTYLAMARTAGAEVLYRHRVHAIDRNDATATWQLSAGGHVISAEYVVNAAGGWSGDVARLVGLDVPVVHVRRNIYSSAPVALAAPLPMTIDIGTGVFIRSEGPRLLFGAIRPDEIAGYNVSVDWPWQEGVLELGVPRFPWLGEIPLDRSGCWAGTYEVSPDHRGIVGADPSEPTWINACGFSGHGVMQSPEVGRLVAEQVVAGGIYSVDARALRVDRFAKGALHTTQLVF
jgi:sarcosine oxidase subunit beta